MMSQQVPPLHAVADPGRHEDTPVPLADAAQLDLARAHVVRLIESYRDGMAALQKVMFAQATSVALEVLAQRTVEHAARRGDEETIDRAISAAAAASRAVDHEDRCAGALASHVADAEIAIADAKRDVLHVRSDANEAPDLLSGIRAERVRFR